MRLLLVICTALAASLAPVVAADRASAQGQPVQGQPNWQRIHGQVQSIQGSTVIFRADDGRLFEVDVSHVRHGAQRALQPGDSATVIGFEDPQPIRFVARFLREDVVYPPRGGPIGVQPGNNTGLRVAVLAPEFLASREFRSANLDPRNPGTADLLVTRFYRGFMERPPSPQERRDWAAYLVNGNELHSMVDYFMRSPEYASRNKTEAQAITDLYEALLGRVPSQAEVATWEQRLGSPPGEQPGYVAPRVAVLIPEFLGSREFRSANLDPRDRTTADLLVVRLYRGFMERPPNPQERRDWVAYLVNGNELRSMVEILMRSPEYTSRSKSEAQAITDLYEALLGRSPSPTEVNSWQQRLAQRG
jgi:hypothetical protein